MLRHQVFGFGDATELDVFVTANPIRGIGNHHGQGVIAVLQVRQNRLNGLTVPGDELPFFAAYVGIAKNIQEPTTQPFQLQQEA